jgi:hypothetical protein
MHDIEHFLITTNDILNEMEPYFHFSLQSHALFLKNKCNHISGEVFVTKQANIAGNDLYLLWEFR